MCEIFNIFCSAFISSGLTAAFTAIANYRRNRPNLSINSYSGRNEVRGCTISIKSSEKYTITLLETRNKSNHLSAESIDAWNNSPHNILENGEITFTLENSLHEIPSNLKFYIKIENHQHQTYWYTIYKGKNQIKIKNGKH